MMTKLPCLLLTVSILSACTAIPVSIQVSDSQPLIPFDSIMKQAVNNVAVGEQARWAGLVLSIEQKGELAEIEVLYLDQTENGKPIEGKPSKGRFKAQLKPVPGAREIKPYTLITVVGKVATPISGLVGDQRYIYPSLSAGSYYVWHKSNQGESSLIRIPPWNTDRICCQDQ